MNSIINRVFHNNHVIFPLWVELSVGGIVHGWKCPGWDCLGWKCPWVGLSVGGMVLGGNVRGWDCPGLKCPVTDLTVNFYLMLYAAKTWMLSLLLGY